jgi:multidrug efflux pump subunit AcrA (membrane-fusion protein)
MRRLLALAILAAAIGGFLLLKATRPAPHVVEVRERVWRVATDSVEPATLRPIVTLYGRIEAPDRMRAAAPVSGRVLEVVVRDGDRVAAGQALARLDPRDLLPRLEQARADLERERIRVKHDREALQQERTLLELAEVKLARVEKLQTARLGAESAVDQAREEVARARLAANQRQQSIAEHPARLAQLEARLDEAERDAERSRIEAPFSARVGKVEVAAGDQVQTGQTLLTLYADDPVYLRAKIPAMYAAELRKALDGGERLLAAASFGTTTFAAYLERIGGEADARGVDALLRVENGENVPVGAFVNAVLERPAVPGLLSLPFSALHGGDRIYLVREGRLRSVRVERVGEHRVDGQPHMLLRVADFVPGSEVMVTHLPNAIDGLAVEVLGQ